MARLPAALGLLVMVLALAAAAAAGAAGMESVRARVVLEAVVEAPTVGRAPLGGLTVVAAVGENVSVALEVVNVGTAVAEDVRLGLPAWPQETFALVEGAMDGAVARLSPGETYRHSFVAVAKRAGLVGARETRAQVTYLDGKKQRRGETLGQPVRVLEDTQFRLLTASFLTEWVQFALLSSALWAVPLVAWLTARRSFDEQCVKRNVFLKAD